MPESLIFLTENSPGVSNDRFGIIAIVLMLVIIAVGGFLPCSKLSSGLAYWFATGMVI